MYPEDRVLVGVVKSKRDLEFILKDQWYRVPQNTKSLRDYQLQSEYFAFFLSGSVFNDLSSSVAYYARRDGIELARRRDLIPSDPDHPRANNIYYKIMLRKAQLKNPTYSQCEEISV